MAAPYPIRAMSVMTTGCDVSRHAADDPGVPPIEVQVVHHVRVEDVKC